MVKKSFKIELDSDADFITEAFGIPNGYIKEIFNMDIPTFENILYITGESGSGKSVMMREFFKETEISFERDRPIFRLASEDVNESLMWLSFVGLGDATIYPLTYNQLSDSQQKRFELMLKTKNNDLVVIDEFLSTLDRNTAKAVAFVFQKMIRKLGKKAVIVTAHDDLESYLMPDAVVKGKSFPSRFISYSDDYEEPFKDIEIFYGDKNIYRELRLGELHYRGKYTGGTKEYLFCKHKDEIIGVLVSTNLIGREGRRISRLVIHPTYRGCGIGRKMVEEYIKDYPLTEVIAVMAKYNPVFEKAGMVRVDNSIVKSPSGLKKFLKSVGNFDFSKWHDKDYCNTFTEDKSIREGLSSFASHAKKYVQPGGKNLSALEIEQYIIKDNITAGRVLHEFRDKEYAKYKTSEFLK